MEAADEPSFASCLDCDVVREPGRRAIDISASARAKRNDGRSGKATSGIRAFGSLSLLLSRMAKSKEQAHPLLKQLSTSR